MKFDANLLPDDPEQLKKMLLELQLVVTKKDSELAEKVFNEAEVTLDEQDEQLLASATTEEKTEQKVKPKRKPLPPELP